MAFRWKAFRYKGLFGSSVAPTHRAYCLLFSFFFGILEVTTSGLFFYVMASHHDHPAGSYHPVGLYIPIGLFVLGMLTIVCTIYIHIKCGLDDADPNLSTEDCANFAKQDELDQTFSRASEQNV